MRWVSDGIPGSPGMERQQQPPLAARLAQVRGSVQVSGNLVGQAERGLAPAREAEKIDGSPNPGLQAGRCTARQCGSDRRGDRRVIAACRDGPSEPEHGGRKLITLTAMPVTRGAFGEGSGGDLVGGG